jgi:hypothetical protein
MPDDRVTDRVSADMERIFRRQDLPPAEVADRARLERSRDFVLHAPATPKPRRRLMRMLTIAIPLLTIAVAAFLFLQIGSDIRPAAVMAEARPPAAVVAPADAAPPRPAPVAYLAAAPMTPAPTIEADDPAPAFARSGSATPPPAIVRKPRAPALASAPAPVAPIDAARRERGCFPGSEENRCIYAEVREADRRLVAAYRAAAEAGVPVGEMRAVRRVWTRALQVSLDDPDGTIRTYDNLTRRLWDATHTMRMDGDRT